MAEKEIKSCSKGCEEMTDNEVIKALEVCAYSDDCLKECPFFNYKADCTKRLTASALEIIKRHQSNVAPVKHGQWLNFYGDFQTAECSQCGECYEVSDIEKSELYGEAAKMLFELFADSYHYCPNCGAKNGRG